MTKKTTTEPTSEWRSLRQSAAYLDCCESSVRNYIARGVLPAYRVKGSRALRIKVSDLDALMVPVPTTGSEQ